MTATELHNISTTSIPYRSNCHPNVQSGTKLIQLFLNSSKQQMEQILVHVYTYIFIYIVVIVHFDLHKILSVSSKSIMTFELEYE